MVIDAAARQPKMRRECGLKTNETQAHPDHIQT